MRIDNGMVVYWKDPESYDNPHNDTSCYDIIYNVDHDEGVGVLGGGTEVFLHECRPLSAEELLEYLNATDTTQYPRIVELSYE